MPKKNKYSSLDDIGLIGTQDKRSKKQQEEDAKLTSAIIKKHKSQASKQKEPHSKTVAVSKQA